MSINLKKVPNTPGVYKFFNNHEIIYIGKAKDLKKRVSSYFGKSKKDRKTSQIKFLTNKVETFTTKNEVEALLLEQMLIKENRPKFNILLRDDKTYPYIYFSLDHEFPGVYSKRTKNAVDKKYYGPFVSSEAVKKSIKEIQKIFKVRNCSDNTFANRTRPCIEFQMKRCSAPCVQKINKVDYFEDITSAKSFLSSSDTKTIERLTKDIEKAVSKLEFEKVSAYFVHSYNFLTSEGDTNSISNVFQDYKTAASTFSTEFRLKRNFKKKDRMLKYAFQYRQTENDQDQFNNTLNEYYNTSYQNDTIDQLQDFYTMRLKKQIIHMTA